MRISAARSVLRDSQPTSTLYAGVRRLRDRYRTGQRLRGRHHLEDRRRHSATLCLVLAGYKDFLWDAVFARLVQHLPPDIDVCVASAGRRDPRLARLSAVNGWSYLTTEDSSVTLIQNLAIHLHPQAQQIVKLDEDVFVTAGLFPTLLGAYERALADGRYDPLLVAPLIPVNGYGHVRIIEKLGLVEAWQERFGQLTYAARHDRPIQRDPAVARFLWGEGGIVPSIDEMAARFAAELPDYRACAIRFSIGAILLPRRTWADMGMFAVEPGAPSLGLDEVQLCTWGIDHSRAILVTENAVAGHLSFGLQNEAMRDYFLNNPERF